MPAELLGAGKEVLAAQ